MATSNNLVEAMLSNQASQQVEQANLAFEQIDRGVRGTAITSVSLSSTTALSATQAKYAMIKVEGNSLTPRTVTVPNMPGMSRHWYVWNATVGGSITFKTVSGEGVVVSNGKVSAVWLDTAGVMRIISGGDTTVGILCERVTTAVETGEIASLASDNDVEASIGESGTLYSIQTDKPARVRIYHTAEARESDLDRPAEEYPSSGIGLLAEVYTDDAKLSIPMSPPADYWNGDSPIAQKVYLAVTSYFDVEATVKVTLTYVANPPS